MKLQPESKKELLRIACGVSLCTAVMWVVFAALHLVGWVVFDYRVLLGGIIGALVAIGNFAGICFVVQKVIDEPDEKKRKGTSRNATTPTRSCSRGAHRTRCPCSRRRCPRCPCRRSRWG